jgi:hypothetical protein
MSDLIIFIIFGAVFYFIWKMIQKKIKASDEYRANLARSKADAIRDWGSIEHEHIEAKTGIWLSTKAKRIMLFTEDGFCKTYSFSDIREWEVNHVRPGQVGMAYGGGVNGLTHNLAAASKNTQLANEARASTGLFLTVKDIDHPKWRIAMADPKLQARWMEILRQSINDD